MVKGFGNPKRPRGIRQKLFGIGQSPVGGSSSSGSIGQAPVGGSSASRSEVGDNEKTFKEWAVGQYREGKMKSSDIGEAASAAVRSGSKDPGVRALSKARPSAKKVWKPKTRKFAKGTRNSARALKRAIQSDSVLGPM